MSSWNELIEEEMKLHGEKLEDKTHIGGVTPTLLQADPLPDMAFIVWSKERVYFPVEFDGCYFVASVPRNPDGTGTFVSSSYPDMP